MRSARPDRSVGRVDVIRPTPSLPFRTTSVCGMYMGRQTEITAREVMREEGDQAGSGQVFCGPVDRTSL